MVNTDSPCTIHQLNCTDTQIISITNAVYGYKSSCQDNNGVLNCRRVGCCNEETEDCFLPFSDDHQLNLTKTCSNRSTCTYSGVRSFDECEQLDVNAYSKIEYTCNERETSTEKITVTRTTEGSTDKTEAKATENPDTAQGTAPTKGNLISSNTDQTETTATENLDTAQGTAPTKDNHSSNTDQTDLWIIIASVIGGVILVSVIVLLSFWIRKKRVQKAGMKNHKSSTYRSNPEESPNLDRTSYVRTYDLINSVENQPALSNKQDNHPEDNNDYDHIGSNKMSNDKPKDDEYDHIRRDYSTGNGDNVNKITNDKPKRRDEYDHIRRDYSPGNDGDVRDVSYESNDDYNILGGHNSRDNPPPTDNTYNHIGEFSANKMDDNDYYNVDKVVKNKSEK
ncbi:hypothetical protein SNE40_020463 [Patella caerulea]|uniref:Uncharacterized protein n=1 Tax=Patella caerulea TaxID=87958 RepID=A0AAN8J196_PATCE